MSTNTVCRVKTVQFDSPAGVVGVVLITADGGEPATADSAVRLVADKLKLERLSRPIRIEGMVVTISGELTVESFARRWRALAIEDSALGLIMSQTPRAEVIHSKAGREISAAVSLLPQATADDLQLTPPAHKQGQVRTPNSSAALTMLMAGSVSA